MQIRDYLIRRLMVLPILLIGVSIIVFALTRVGGSPIGIYMSHEMTPEEVEELEDRYGLNDPLPVQYVAWAGGVLRGDLGWSGVAVAPVTQVFRGKLAATMELATAAGLVAVTLGITLGDLRRVQTRPITGSPHPCLLGEWLEHAGFLVRHRAAHRVLGLSGLVPGRPV